jgi:HpcH/HpaI aldolase/citrate lyase family
MAIKGPAGRLNAEFLTELDAGLAGADAAAALYPGEAATRQPVHTAYVPADRYDGDTIGHWGHQALALLDRHAPSPARFVEVTGLRPVFAEEIYSRVRAKLGRQPVEDLRVDFEDGYGLRPDAEEDATARAAGQALAQLAGPAAGSASGPAPRTGPGAPLLAGIRIKGLQAATRSRGLRTLDLLIGAALEAGGLPSRFVVTLPKVAHVAEVSAAVQVCEQLEAGYGLAAGALRFELQIEVPQAVIGPDGVATVALLLHAAQGRCEGLHYGTYDFSAAAGVVAGEQSLEHPLADHAKAVMQLAAAQTGVRVSDGSTNVVPVGSAAEIAAAWQLHARLVQRSLRRALYQGWDLHPGHLLTRYAATYDFYRGELLPSCARLAQYTSRAASGFLDEPATALALAGAVLRAVDCGACDPEEAEQATGLDRAALLTLAGRTEVTADTAAVPERAS